MCPWTHWLTNGECSPELDQSVSVSNKIDVTEDSRPGRRCRSYFPKKKKQLFIDSEFSSCVMIAQDLKLRDSGHIHLRIYGSARDFRAGFLTNWSCRSDDNQHKACFDTSVSSFYTSLLHHQRNLPNGLVFQPVYLETLLIYTYSYFPFYSVAKDPVTAQNDAFTESVISLDPALLW